MKARVTYQRVDKLPFLALLPVQAPALYQVQSPRDLVTLTGDSLGVGLTRLP